MHYGLIGYPLSHSFSPAFFTQKFQKLGLLSHSYSLFPLENISDFPAFILKNPQLSGFNVTIPHKQAIIPYLDELDASAQAVGAVNVVKMIKNGKNNTLKGYNTDVYGFMQTIAKYLHEPKTTKNNDFDELFTQKNIQAMILGEGGASLAVKNAFLQQNIPFQTISRRENSPHKHYTDVTPEMLAEYTFIVNTTPIGMYPNVEEKPLLPYNHLQKGQILIDLIYNPEETAFLRAGKEKGCFIENGLTMLHAQAEKAWDIWQLQTKK